MSGSPKRIQGLFVVLDRSVDEGLENWRNELLKRDMPAVILLDDSTIEHNAALVQRISVDHFDIGCCYNESPFWDEDYETQNEIMSRIADRYQLCTQRPLRLFASKYFAYNEDSLKIADKLGIQYIPARGTHGVKSVVYQPEEYAVKIISLSNVPSKKMGTGSLCDISLWSRTETPKSFRDILEHIHEEKIVLVAQTNLSGVKLNWWNVYQDYFESNRVDWQTLDGFTTDTMVLPVKKIPVNTKVDYRTPQPLIPLENEPDLPHEGGKM
jgi:peptidoglycan/xylan/chitin deacetylase (PgdA/CDA1 family)